MKFRLLDIRGKHTSSILWCIIIKKKIPEEFHVFVIYNRDANHYAIKHL